MTSGRLQSRKYFVRYRTYRYLLFGFSLPFQLAFTRFGKLLPSIGHLFKLLALCGLCRARHLTALIGVL